jgi:hypothetical protein
VGKYYDDQCRYGRVTKSFSFFKTSLANTSVAGSMTGIFDPVLFFTPQIRNPE